MVSIYFKTLEENPKLADIYLLITLSSSAHKDCM